MTTPTTGTVRLVRALLLAVLVVALAAAAHAVGGGHVPPLVLLAGLVALLMPVTTWLTGRRLGVAPVLVLLAVGQVALHHVLGFVAGCAVVAPAGAGHAVHSAVPGALASAGQACGHGAAADAPAMVAAHVAATVLTAVLAAGAERALWHVLDALAPLRRVLEPFVGLVAERSGPVAARVPAVGGALHLRAQPARRGPPRAPMPRPHAQPA